MNKVTGRVFREDGSGIGNLLVVLYQVDPDLGSQNLQGMDPEKFLAEFRGMRIASVATSLTGSFVIEYKDEEIVRQGESCRPALLLTVVAPEGVATRKCPVVLHMSGEIRVNAGRSEHYLIQIGENVLIRAGLGAYGSSSSRAGPAAKDLNQRLQELGKAGELAKEERKRRWTQIVKRRAAAQKAMGRAEDWLSHVSTEVRESPRYVRADESIVKKNIKAMTDEIENTIGNAKPVLTNGVSVMSGEMLSALKDHDGNWKKNMPSALFDPARKGLVPNVVATPGLERVDPSVYCRKLSNPDEDCAGHVHLGAMLVPATAVPDATAAPAPVAPAAVDTNDLAPHIGALLAAGHSGAAISGTRADSNAVQSNVDAFELRSGPADVTAEYEFHNLQIAFDHVWSEVFDQKVLEAIRAVYGTMLDMGAVLPDAATIGTVGNLTGLAPQEEPIPPVVVKNFEITAKEWALLGDALQSELTMLASTLDARRVAPIAGVNLAFGTFTAGETVESRKREIKAYAEAGARIIYHAKDLVAGKPDAMNNLHTLLKDLNARLLEPYTFTVFAANAKERSVNFGLLTTYRQRWQPVCYQAGELVATIPLAPKESRRFKKRTVVRHKRSEREQQTDERKRTQDSSETSRGEAEIVRKAMTRSNFNVASEGGLNLGLFNASVKTGLSHDAEKNSAETKRDFREAVNKAAQEYRAERKIELVSESEDEAEVEESGEIVNPNDELTVTYLFYELQRRYNVSERIHVVTPVVLVAQEVPQPQQIDDFWLLSHDWILRRVLLDQSLLPALDYLATRIVGDEHALEVMRKNLMQQRALVADLKEETVSMKEMLGRRYAALERSIATRASAIESEASEGFFADIGEFFAGDDVSPEALQIRETAARDAHENAVREERELRGRLDREVTSLETASRDYSKLLGEHLNRKTQIARLRVHVKLNLLHYMQAIWSYEPPDQRFFRLHRVEAPRFEGELISNIVSPVNAAPGTPVRYQTQCNLSKMGKATLSELADLDRLLGFKGNYMIFPLKESNCLTDFMMVPYVDAQFGVRDPDEFGNWTLEEFASYVCCLKHTMNADAFADIRAQLRERYMALLSTPRRDKEEIIVPTGQLFIEALPGTHPLLEEFKLRHRATDASAAFATLREKELENVRLAARILAGELEDPKIDRKVMIEGLPGGVVVDGPP